MYDSFRIWLFVGGAIVRQHRFQANDIGAAARHHITVFHSNEAQAIRDLHATGLHTEYEDVHTAITINCHASYK